MVGNRTLILKLVLGWFLRLRASKFLVMVWRWLEVKESLCVVLFGYHEWMRKTKPKCLFVECLGVPDHHATWYICIGNFSLCTKDIPDFWFLWALEPWAHAWRASMCVIYTICPYLHVLDSVGWSNVPLQRLSCDGWRVN